jgi:L-arabinose isomerase
MRQPPPPEIWLVTGTEHLYGDTELQTVSRSAREVAGALDESGEMPLPVKVGPVTTTADALRTVCRSANNATRCTGVVFWMRSVSAARTWMTALTTLEKPLCVLHTGTDREIPGSRRTVVVGHWNDRAVLEAVGRWSRAARGVREYGSVKVTNLSDAETAASLARHISAVSDRDAGHRVDEYHERYQVSAEFEPEGPHHGRLLSCAKLELGLHALLNTAGSAAFTSAAPAAGSAAPADSGAPAPGGVADLADLSSLGGLVTQRLMASGFGYAGAGDAPVATLVRTMKVMGEGLGGGTSYLEHHAYVSGTSGMLVVGTGALELCPTIAAPDARPLLTAGPAGTAAGVPRLVFGAAPGRGVTAALAHSGSGARLITNQVSIFGPDQEHLAAGLPEVNWEPLPDRERASRRWSAAGGSSRMAITTSLSRTIISSWAEMTGTPLTEVDDEDGERRSRRGWLWG